MRGYANFLLVVPLALFFCWEMEGPLKAQTNQPSGQEPKKELIAVLDLSMVGGTPAQSTALSNQLRVEILRTGRVTLVDRSQIDNVLKEQALQQSGCTTEECAVDVGKILGIRKIVTGTVTKVENDFWQVAVQMIDVESSETVRSEALNHQGDFQSLVFTGMSNVAALLFRTGQAVAVTPPPAVTARPPVSSTPAPPPPVARTKEGGPGCGPGKMVFEGQRGILPQVLAVTTNNFYGPWQMFAISSGTSGCDSNAVIMTDRQQEEFVSANLDELSQQMAVGRGEHLALLAAIMGCDATTTHDFGAMTQVRYEVLFPHVELEARELLQTLRHEIAVEPALRARCIRA